MESKGSQAKKEQQITPSSLGKFALVK